MPNTVLPSPAELGLPEKFSQWRLGQDRAVVDALASDKRFVVLAIPVGGGKSLAYLGAAVLSGIRTAFLTSTKGLQSQLLSDFSPALVDIRGQNNYPCNYDDSISVSNRPPCDEGPCHAGIKCDRQKGGGCDYYDAVSVARNTSLVVTNYSYWMHALDQGEGLGTFGMLVLDEAHDAPSCLSDYLAVELHGPEIEGTLGEPDIPEHDSMDDWKSDSRRWLDRLRVRREDLSSEVKAQECEDRRGVMREIRAIKHLEKKLNRLATAQGEWVWEVARRGPLGRHVIRFDPVWPADYAERELFSGIPKIILTSATIRPKTLDLLGVRRADVDFMEFPSSFPVRNRPVYFIPSVKMDKNAGPEHFTAWMSKIDSIIRARLGRKGIIHTVSYERAHYLLRHSEYRNHMMIHETRTAQQVVAEFKRKKAPAILVSPSMATGYDFIGDLCRWQILAKVPFVDTRNKVTKARTERDAAYGLYIAAQQIVQASGRSTRSEDDWSETFLVDDNFSWLVGRHKEHFPKWFLDAVKWVHALPNPLEVKSKGE